VLRNYTGYDGETVPAIETLRRREIADGTGQRYRGRWLVIDEFTRAPVDAAFGSLLTTLGGQRSPLLVPTDRGDVAVPLPKDFRIIGTLNSFDRHFLNQMSEAMKRRFVFIDILPPGRAHSEAEQGMAIYRALRKLAEQGMLDVTTDLDDGRAVWEDLLTVGRAEDDPGSDEAVRYEVQTDDTEVKAVLRDLWRIFRAIRVYRQLGTAQAEAVYSALLTGSSVGMGWPAALDAALADTLADQLQVLNRDEQRVLLAFLEHAASPEQFTEQVHGILHLMPGPRQLAHLMLLKAAAPAAAAATFDPTKLASLAPAHLGSLFDLGTPLLVNHDSLFARRLSAFVNERGL
jgi:PAS domain-containing protein